MRLHENWELFSDALQTASQPVEVEDLASRAFSLRRTIGFVARCH